MANLMEVLGDLKALRKSKARAKAGVSHGSGRPTDAQKTEEEWRRYAIKNVDEGRETLTRIIEKLEALIGQ